MVQKVLHKSGIDVIIDFALPLEHGFLRKYAAHFIHHGQRNESDEADPIHLIKEGMKVRSHVYWKKSKVASNRGIRWYALDVFKREDDGSMRMVIDGMRHRVTGGKEKRKSFSNGEDVACKSDASLNWRKKEVEAEKPKEQQKADVDLIDFGDNPPAAGSAASKSNEVNLIDFGEDVTKMSIPPLPRMNLPPVFSFDVQAIQDEMKRAVVKQGQKEFSADGCLKDFTLPEKLNEDEAQKLEKEFSKKLEVQEATTVPLDKGDYSDKMKHPSEEQPSISSELERSEQRQAAKKVVMESVDMVVSKVLRDMLNEMKDSKDEERQAGHDPMLNDCQASTETLEATETTEEEREGSKSELPHAIVSEEVEVPDKPVDVPDTTEDSDGFPSPKKFEEVNSPVAEQWFLEFVDGSRYSSEEPFKDVIGDTSFDAHPICKEKAREKARKKKEKSRKKKEAAKVPELPKALAKNDDWSQVYWNLSAKVSQLGSPNMISLTMPEEETAIELPLLEENLGEADVRMDGCKVELPEVLKHLKSGTEVAVCLKRFKKAESNFIFGIEMEAPKYPDAPDPFMDGD